MFLKIVNGECFPVEAVRGADAVYLAVAQRLQLPLVSWDGELLERAAALVTTYRPGEVVGPAEK